MESLDPVPSPDVSGSPPGVESLDPVLSPDVSGSPPAAGVGHVDPATVRERARVCHRSITTPMLSMRPRLRCTHNAFRAPELL